MLHVSRASELSFAQGCVLWCITVVIPASLRQRCLIELPNGHFGVVKMKSLARRLLWWPGLDADIEQTVEACAMC